LHPLTLEPLEPRDTPAIVGADPRVLTEFVEGQFLSADSIQRATVVAPNPVHGGGPVLQLTDAATGRVLQTEFVLDPAWYGGLHITAVVGTTGGRTTGDGRPMDKLVVTGGPGAGDVLQILSASLDGTRLVVESTFSAHLGADFRAGLKITSASAQPFGSDSAQPLILAMPDSAGYGPRVVAVDEETGEIVRSFFVGPAGADSTRFAFSPLGGSFTTPRTSTVSILVYTGPADPATHRRPASVWSFDAAKGDFGRDLTGEFAGYDDPSQPIVVG
jgi:hypothetical protein